MIGGGKQGVMPVTEIEFIEVALLTIAAAATLATVVMVAFFWWAERGRRDDHDSYQAWHPDKWDRE